jgi:hypothetical protein
LQAVKPALKREYESPGRHTIWLLKLALPLPYGRVLTGLLLLVVLLSLFHASAAGADEDSAPTLFFSLIIAYIVPVFGFITAKAQEALEALRPTLDMTDVQYHHARTRLDSASLRLTLGSLAWGVLAGFAHLCFIRGSAAAAVDDMLSSVSGALTAGGTLMVWVVMTTVISMLLQQAIVFGRLGGNHARISLLTIRKLVPFARVSIISSLAVLGALALFPLINVESGLDLKESVPGAVIILGPLVIMFIIPVWPLHRRLVQLKQQELSGLQERIEAVLAGSTGVNLTATQIEKLLPLLNYRREISQLSTWPFDLGNITMLLFYLIIPPLTWVGAALVENLVNMAM